MSKKYILNPDGSITNLKNRSDSADSNNIGDKKLYETINTTFNQSSREILANEFNIPDDIFGTSLDGVDKKDPKIADIESTYYNFELFGSAITKVKSKKLVNDSHDFKITNNAGQQVNALANKKVETILNFNTTGGDSDVFASEFEIAGGISSSLNLAEAIKKITLGFKILIDAIVHIAAAEVIFTLSKGITGKENHIEENFKLHFGSNGAIDISSFDAFIFKRLNYPRHKTRSYQDIDERIAAFIIGFTELITADNFIDFQKIKNIKNTNEHINNISAKYGSSFEMGAILKPGSLVGSSIYYLSDSLATLSSVSINRLILIERKISHQNYWVNQLYNSKQIEISQDNSSIVDNFMKSMDYYFFKFVIERMHIGLKLIRYYEFSGTPDTHLTHETPLNRVGLSKSGKKPSRVRVSDIDFYNWQSRETGSTISQATRVRALPQALIMSNEIAELSGSPLLNSKKNNEISSELLQNFSIRPKNANKRLSASLVKSIEEYLNAEYMPFYFHDLRTNEIVSFHAFIDNISDSFSPEYATHSGFGRIDDVKNYVKTTRNISLSFTIASTSQEDHELMWYQINKIVSMVYPQWSRGIKSSKFGTTFPFTQIPTNSPLIRLRVGDVIKSNYSKKNLSRKFGWDKLHQNLKHKRVNKSNVEFNHNTSGIRAALDTQAPSFSSSKNNAGKNIDMLREGSSSIDDIRNAYDITEANNTGGKYMRTSLDFSLSNYYLMPGLYLTRFSNPKGFDWGDLGLGKNRQKQYIHIKEYEKIDRDTLKWKNAETKGFRLKNSNYSNLEFFCDTNSIVEKNSYIAKPKEAEVVWDKPYDYTDTGWKLKSDKTYTIDSRFLFGNPVLDAYESSKGEGLAGFITNLDINYNDQLWETSMQGSKAPHVVKITLSYSPIHDIPLGLDAEGMMTAPAYNVGPLNNMLFSSPYDNAVKDYDEYIKNVDKLEKDATKTAKIIQANIDRLAREHAADVSGEESGDEDLFTEDDDEGSNE